MAFALLYRIFFIPEQKYSSFLCYANWESCDVLLWILSRATNHTRRNNSIRDFLCKKTETTRTLILPWQHTLFIYLFYFETQIAISDSITQNKLLRLTNNAHINLGVLTHPHVLMVQKW